MCFVFIWEQTATCATYSINWLVFITEMKSVYCAVRTGSLDKAVCASSLNAYIRVDLKRKRWLKIFCLRNWWMLRRTHTLDLRSPQLRRGRRVITGGVNVNILKFILKNKNRKYITKLWDSMRKTGDTGRLAFRKEQRRRLVIRVSGYPCRM